MSVQSQWALDSTAQGSLSVLTGLLKAASSDNVQALALLVCEKFGGTLAMSSQTIRKVETTIVPTPPPATVAFLRASIGFSTNDCATQLGGSKQGQRFLGLAAALVTTVGPFNGAKALGIMMEASKIDQSQDNLIPTTRHLTDILQSLAARSLRCGFRETVATWEVLLRVKVFPILNSPGKSVPGYPAIVDALRQVARVGQASIIGVTIKIGAGAAWVLAFAQWCLDIPPSLFIDDNSIVDPPGSLVKISIPASLSNNSIEVTIHHNLKSLTHLLTPATRYFTYGMVSLGSYSTWLLHDFGFGGKTGRRLLNQALQYAIPQILPNMTCGKFGRLGRNSNSVANYSINDPLDSRRFTALPDIHVVADVCGQFLGEGDVQTFTILSEGSLFEHLPLIKRHLEHLQQNCGCNECQNKTEKDAETLTNDSLCNISDFFYNLSTIIMNILTLSLFESPSTVLIRPSHERYRGANMRNSICQLLWTGKPQKYEDGDLLNWARSMVGHIFDDEDRSLILTSSQGQVVYPAAYETYRVEKSGYLRLLCFPGILKYNGDSYNVVASKPIKARYLLPSSCSSISSNGSDLSSQKRNQGFGVLQPVNLHRNASVSWKISIQENQEMQADLMIAIREKEFRATRNPECALLSLRDTLICESCPHNSRARMTEADHFTTNQPPWFENKATGSEELVNIIPVDCSDALRYFALASNDSSAVLRRQACLRCCLEVCRDNDAQVLIL